ncbi:MAG TPA: hypothetical protein VFX96_01850 [Pyrinomonadaceae bacterium]|nr:hypothetical protein [Pyrinomonadaceae bacterium]
MTHKIFALLIALATFSAHAVTARANDLDEAQGPPNRWEAVQAIGGGVKVVVRTKDGEKKEGHFENATDSVLVIRRDGKSVSFDRANVRRVSYKGGTSHKKGALVGAAIGGGSGAAWGGFMYGSANGEFPGFIIPGFSVIGAGIGAAIGGGLGMGKKDVTVYESF